MRPCTKIGMVFGNMKIVGARTITNENGKECSQYRIRCVRCDAEQWSNTTTVMRGTAKCKTCDDVKYVHVKKGAGSKHPKLYSVYRGMKRRCYSKKCEKYPYYGGRGVTICIEWLNDFETFVSWAMENGWDETKTIDRIDVNGNYEPKNCRWVNQKTQVNNQRKNIRLDYMGENITLAQFCEKTGTGYDRARYLIFRKGMSAEEALKAIQRNR